MPFLIKRSLQNRKSVLREYVPSPFGAAKEDNVEERENFEVKQFFGVLHVTCYGRTYVRTDGRTYGQRDVKVEILF